MFSQPLFAKEKTCPDPNAHTLFTRIIVQSQKLANCQVSTEVVLSDYGRGEDMLMLFKLDNMSVFRFLSPSQAKTSDDWGDTNESFIAVPDEIADDLFSMSLGTTLMIEGQLEYRLFNGSLDGGTSSRVFYVDAFQLSN